MVAGFTSITVEAQVLRDREFTESVIPMIPIARKAYSLKVHHRGFHPRSFSIVKNPFLPANGS